MYPKSWLHLRVLTRFFLQQNHINITQWMEPLYRCSRSSLQFDQVCLVWAIENDRRPKGWVSMGNAIEGFHHFNIVNRVEIPTSLADLSEWPCWSQVQPGHQEGSANREEENSRLKHLDFLNGEADTVRHYTGTDAKMSPLSIYMVWANDEQLEYCDPWTCPVYWNKFSLPSNLSWYLVHVSILSI